jgi:methylmalonyl-CoA/ethylmalonyl-CoA epimerase
MSANAPFGLAQIGQIALTVSNVDKALAFYRDVLGMRLLFQAPPKMAFFDCAGLRLMLSEPEQGAFQPSGTVVYFKVADIEAAHAALSGRGVAFEEAPHLIARMPDHDLWMAFFRDPDRNLFALMCEKSKS